MKLNLFACEVETGEAYVLVQGRWLVDESVGKPTNRMLQCFPAYTSWWEGHDQKPEDEEEQERRESR